MAGPPPQLPPLPSGFGNVSSYPPHPSSHNSRVASGGQIPPPVPPLPPGALEREQQHRAQLNRSPQPSSRPPNLHSYHPHSPAPGPTSGLVPGQIIRSTSFQAASSPFRYTRSPSPLPGLSLGTSQAPPLPPQPPQHHGFGFPQPQLHPGPGTSSDSGTHFHSLQPFSSLPHHQPSQPDRPHSATSFRAGPGGSSVAGDAPGRLAPSPFQATQSAYTLGSSAAFQNAAGSSLAQPMANMALGPAPSSHMPRAGYHHGYERRASGSEVSSSGHPSRQRSSVQNHGAAPSLNSPLPDMEALEQMRDRALAHRDDQQQIAWAKQVLKFVERKFTDGSKISEPKLVKWTDEAIATIKRLAALGRPNLEALYLRGDLQASGAFPTYLRKDLKEAFNDFELSARLGYPASWFRIGRDYELLNDLARARDAYNRGIVVGDVGSMYRLGMANLLGQLEIPVNYTKAITMLRDAADRANLDTPQPAYIYGMLLAGEFNHVDIPTNLLRSSIHGQAGPDVRNSSASDKAVLEAHARRRIERAAFLNFAPAQYKCGWNYEYAQLDCAFDPLLSVQYYSLASQGGEIEADMALSKWFLCGADGCFEKNEELAFTFADKAARKGLASAEFALGYYFEVGVGTDRNLDTAKRWYKKAAAQDNEDAKERLKALQAGGDSRMLSRGDHEVHVDEKVQRKRTMAKIKSDKEGRSQRDGGDGTARGKPDQSQQDQGAELNRKKTMRLVEETAAASGGRTGAGRRQKAAVESVAPPMPAVASLPELHSASPKGPTASASTALPSRARPLQPPGPAMAKDRISSGTMPSSPGRHGSGYSLTDTPMAVSSSAPSSASLSTPPPAASSSDTQVSSATSGGSIDKSKVYSTFEEMGFKPQKAKKEECVVM